MKPVPFPCQTHVYAKDQPEYLPLPVHKTEDGICTSCWSLSWRERWKIMWTGRIWWSQLTFNGPLQPVHPDTTCPIL